MIGAAKAKVRVCWHVSQPSHLHLLQPSHLHFLGDDKTPTIDVDDHLPIISYLLQTLLLTDVHQIQDIFLEATASKANTCVQELVANAAVHTDGLGHLQRQILQYLTNNRHL